ncbi:MAG: sugar phosphate isomerase/epimerase [Kiritimatiellae bacterium]|nr:sugar phosphate isomerase/epimerase [Kiritimatiellia bacterium]
MKCGRWDIGVCSWSLQAELDGVIGSVRSMGIDRLHLAVRGIDAAAVGAQLATNGIAVSCTMMDFPQEDYSSLEAIKLTGGVGPDDCWEANKQSFEAAVAATVALGVTYLSLHAGFIDESNPVYAQKFKDRITCLADIAAAEGIMLLLETGQESATDLKAFLEELSHPALGVNFDPANMILYDKGEPLEALRVLAPWIKHVHIKDATRTTEPGTWGAEVPWGDGEVQADAFVNALKEIGYAGAIAIEREAGDSRVADITAAVERLSRFVD